MPEATEATNPSGPNLVAVVARVTLKSPTLLVEGATGTGICEYSVPVLNLAGTIRREGVGILRS